MLTAAHVYAYQCRICVYMYIETQTAQYDRHGPFHFETWEVKMRLEVPAWTLQDLFLSFVEKLDDELYKALQFNSTSVMQTFNAS